MVHRTLRTKSIKTSQLVLYRNQDSNIPPSFQKKTGVEYFVRFGVIELVNGKFSEPPTIIQKAEHTTWPNSVSAQRQVYGLYFLCLVINVITLPAVKRSATGL